MSNKGKLQLVPLLVICCLFVPIALGAEPPRMDDVTLPAGDWLDNAATERLIIRSLYDRLASYAQGSGLDLKFTIGDLQTLQPGDFESVRWLEIVSVPGGASLEMMRNVHENGYTRWAGVIYEPTWTWKAEAWNSPEEKEKLRSMSIAEALRLVADERPELLEAEALVSYEVTAEMAGRSRTYRAALLWLPVVSASERTLVVVDGITQGVEEAAREALPPAGRDDFRMVFEESLDNRSEKASTCRSSSSTTQQGYLSRGTSGHKTGSHYSQATFQATCTCSSSCASTCTASIPSGTCREEGTRSSIFACHKMASSSKANTNRMDDGRRQGASCAAGLGCVEKNCSLCLCGIGVSVTIGGSGVSFSVTGSPEWTGNLQYSRTCGVCR